MRRMIKASAAAFLFTSLLTAATAPPLMNYEGVLRNSANVPLSGDYDMVFRFLDSSFNEVLVDSHTALQGGQVTVSGGLFNVTLGIGDVTDGTGPGTYTSIDQVFRDYAIVYLQITVGAETLAPPIRIVSSAYALNASNLGGKGANQYLDTTSTAQAKAGPLSISSPTPATALNVTGTEVAGHFQTGFNEAFLASSAGGIKGFGTTGVDGVGSFFGGWFHHMFPEGVPDSNGGSVLLGGGNAGVIVTLNNPNGYAARFTNAATTKDVTIAQGIGGAGVYSSVEGGAALSGLVTTTGTGVQGDGGAGIGVAGVGSEGGFFSSHDTASYGRVGASTYKIQGTGAVSFVQNHPFDNQKVIVYASPEGDEVGVYTRGSARLENGEARVPLGETFQWVTNPDIGLTAHLTPRGRWSELYVESVSPTELVVRSAGGDLSATFDYVVQGLRIGFEEVSIVQEKHRESFIPSMAEHRQRYAQHPELRAYNALERFKEMPAAVAAAGSGDLDAARATALKNAIHEYDPTVDGPVSTLAGFAVFAAPAARPDPAGTERSMIANQVTATREAGIVSRPAGTADVKVSSQDAARRVNESSDGPELALQRNDIDRAVMLPVTGIVEPGDVLVADAESSESLRRSSVAADPAVIGVAAGASDDGRAPVTVTGVVLCKVDASYGSIRPGDLLSTSPTPGHAMKHTEAIAGTILGKALGRLDDGAGLMKILLTVR